MFDSRPSKDKVERLGKILRDGHRDSAIVEFGEIARLGFGFKFSGNKKSQILFQRDEVISAVSFLGMVMLRQP
ncbi:MAG: hypothetical protein IH899_21030 [Planctomycetes bacterium]|nr:hypothetical protein [Planctomycetota bacterium]